MTPKRKILPESGSGGLGRLALLLIFAAMQCSIYDPSISEQQCKPKEKRCNGNTVQECNSGGTGWEARGECPAGWQCVDAGCHTSISFSVEIAVSPLVLDFGQVEVGGNGRKTATIKNLSDEAVLEIKEIIMEDESPFSTEFGSFFLLTNEFLALTFDFEPEKEGPATSHAIIRSNASNHLPADDETLGPGEVRLELKGEGTACRPALAACVEPDLSPECMQPQDIKLDFGYVAVNQPASRQFIVRNDTAAESCCDLIINDFKLYEGDEQCDLDSREPACRFSVTTAHSTPATIPCGASASVVVAFQTPRRGEVNGKIRLETNDPDQSVVAIPLHAIGDEPPVCVMSGAEEVSLSAGQGHVLDGSQSFDPDGGVPLSFKWLVTQAPDTWTGSRDLGTGSSVTFMSWQAGEYLVCLEVTDAMGISNISQCCARISVVLGPPLGGFQAEVVWDNFQSDLDAHMKPAAAQWFSDQDCHFANCKSEAGAPGHPNWGDQSSNDDDPVMEIDDADGFGPENIVIEEIAPGQYDYAVHYWSSHGRQPVESNCTVRVYLQGQLSAEFFMPLTGDCQLWHVFTLDWPSGDFTEGSISLWNEQCGGGW